MTKTKPAYLSIKSAAKGDDVEFHVVIKNGPDMQLQELCNLLPQKRHAAWSMGGGYLCAATEPAAELFIPVLERCRFDDDLARLKWKVLSAQIRARDEQAERISAFSYDLPDMQCEPPSAYAGFPRWKHQAAGLSLCVNRQAMALLWEMGTGKTKTIADRISYETTHVHDDEKRPYIAGIIAPKALRRTWRIQLEQHAWCNYVYVPLHAGLKSTNVDRLTQGLKLCRETPGNNALVFFIGYEKIRSLEDILHSIPIDLLVADESTKIKNPLAKRTKAAIKLAHHARQRMILTGSPFGNNALDLYSQFEFLEKGALGYDTWHSFRNHYGQWGGFGGFQLMNYKNLVELKARAARYAFVVKKKDCLDLPEKDYTKRYVALPPMLRQAYDTFADKAIAELDTLGIQGKLTSEIILTKMLRLSELTSSIVAPPKDDQRPELGYGRRLLDQTPKLDSLVDLFDEIDPNSKMVVWSRFPFEMKAAAARLQKMGKKVALYYGTDKQKDAAEKAFQEDDSVDVFIGNPQSAGMGLTLIGTSTRPVTTVVYLSESFSHIDRVQSEDRTHRGGMHAPVLYINIVAERSIDEVVAMRLAKKKKGAMEFSDRKGYASAFSAWAKGRDPDYMEDVALDIDVEDSEDDTDLPASGEKSGPLATVWSPSHGGSEKPIPGLVSVSQGPEEARPEEATPATEVTAIVRHKAPEAPSGGNGKSGAEIVAPAGSEKPNPTLKDRRSAKNEIEVWVENGIKSLTVSNGNGWRVADAEFGITLESRLPYLTDAEWSAAQKMLKKYAKKVGKAPAAEF